VRRSFCWMLVCLWGCSHPAEGPERHRITGHVTFDGKPVPFGSVIFDPDVSAGNSGPQGAANIVNGQFDTAARGGRGASGGSTLITVTGMTKAAALEGEDPGLLFTDYQIKRDLGKEGAVIEIDVPADAGRSKAFSPRR